MCFDHARDLFGYKIFFSFYFYKQINLSTLINSYGKSKIVVLF